MHKKYAFFIVFVLTLLFVPVAGQITASWCGIQNLMFEDNTTSNITPAGYQNLINYPSGKPEVDANVTISASSGNVSVGTFISPEGVLSSTQELLPGLRKYVIYAYTSGSPGENKMTFTAFRRFANGTEQNFYTMSSIDINANTVTQYDLNYVSSVKLDLFPTDRVGIKVYAHTTHSSPVTIHFVYQGIEHASYFQSGYFVCGDPPVIGQKMSTHTIPLPILVPIIALLVSIIAASRRM